MKPAFSAESRIAALERENKHLRDTPTSYACMILADVRHKTGVNEKPMLAELADAILARFEGERKKDRERIEKLEGALKKIEAHGSVTADSKPPFRIRPMSIEDAAEIARKALEGLGK